MTSEARLSASGAEASEKRAERPANEHVDVIVSAGDRSASLRRGIALELVEQVERDLKVLKSEIFTHGASFSSQTPSQQARLLRQVLRARRAREDYFGLVFADPAWDMLLEAYVSWLTGTKTSVSGLCAASAVPSSTGLRWLQKLEEKGFIHRRLDRFDRRRTWIELTQEGAARMVRYFQAVEQRGLI